MSTIFPYYYTSVQKKWWERVRVAGNKSSYVMKNALSYLIKSQYSSKSAPQEEITYFQQHNTIKKAVIEEEKHEIEGVSLALCGDLMWVRFNWSSFLDSGLLAYLRGFDTVLVNLETPIAKSFSVPKLLPITAIFNAKPGLIDSFQNKESGASLFGAVSLANNHLWDKKKKGLEETVSLLKERHIPFSGMQLEGDPKTPFEIIDVKGISVGFYAATYGVNDRAEENIEIPLNLISEAILRENDWDAAKKKVYQEHKKIFDAMREAGAEMIVASLHWGFEYEWYPDPKIMQLAREVVRAGADIIMGHHPHFVQPVEICFVNGYEQRYSEALQAQIHENGSLVEDERGVARKALVVYSLGNLVTSMYGSYSEIGLIQALKLYRDEETQGIEWNLEPYQLVYNAKCYKENFRKTLRVEEYLSNSCGQVHCSRQKVKKINEMHTHLGYPENQIDFETLKSNWNNLKYHLTRLWE